MEEGGGCGGAVPWLPVAHACWGIVAVHTCWVLIAVRACWCWALVRSLSVVFVLCSLVIHGRVAGRLWLQVSLCRCCPHLHIVSCRIVVFTCCGHGGPLSSLVVVMGCCVGVLSARHVCWSCCGSRLLLGRGCAVSLLSGCSHCAMLFLSGRSCHVSLSCVSAR